MSEPKTNYDQKVSKATLEFFLPEGEHELRLALDANRWYSVAWDLEQMLRSNIKHGNNTVEELAVYEKIRSSLHDLMEESGLHFD